MQLKNFSFLGLLLATIAAPLAAQATVQPVYNPANGRYYFLTPHLSRYDDVRSIAVALGGELVKIDDAAEQAFLAANFSVPVAPEWLFIGLNDVAAEGVYVWQDGSAAGYTNWLPGEPSNFFEQDAVAMTSPATGSGWNDVSTAGGGRGIVEATGLAGYAPTTVFSESFADNAAGWTLGAEWQIGAAVAANGSIGDPGVDGSGATGGGLAGVAIGADYSSTPHAASYLTSPVIPLVAGVPTILEFRRWLTTDYLPFVGSMIEVFDGAAWQTLWFNNATGFLSASTWTTFAYDVTAYANPAFRFRFGFAVFFNAIDRGGWSVDDVKLVTHVQPCTLQASRPNGPGSLAIRNVSCDGASTALTIITLNTAPGGWFFGVAPTLLEFELELGAFAPPFFSVLDAQGGSNYSVPGGVPAGLAFRAVTVPLSPFLTPMGASAPILFTTY